MYPTILYNFSNDILHNFQIIDLQFICFEFSHKTQNDFLIVDYLH